MALVAHAVASLFPDMSAEEFAALKSDIEANGQREPIWLHEGRIIDGRHRYRACSELKRQPITRDWDGKGSLVGFVVSLNLHRRSLTSSQRAAIATDALPMLKVEADKRQADGQQRGRDTQRSKSNGQKPLSQIVDSSRNDGKAAEQAAKIFNTNRQHVADAKKLAEKAPDIHAAVRRGEKTIPQAKNELRKREKLEHLEAKAKAANGKLSKESPSWTLINADVIDGLASVRDHHAAPRLIFADPPYNIGIDYGEGEKADRMPYGQYLLWFAEWIGACHDILTTDGSLWVMIGDEYAAEYAVALKRTGFTIRSWVKWYETFGVNCQRNFNRTSRHIFYAVKNSKDFVFNESAVSRPSDRQTKYGDKRAAEGGKIIDDVWTDIPRLTGTCDERIPQFPTQLPVKLVKRIVDCASDPGDLVVDPFSGSATTGVACLQAKHGTRRFVGIDKSEQFIDLADKRLKAVTL